MEWMKIAPILILLLLEAYFLCSQRWVLASTPPILSFLFAGLSFSQEAPFSHLSPLIYLAFVAYCLVLYGLLRLLRRRKSNSCKQDPDDPPL